ncbi:MAG: hypothetical protein R6T93_02885 [Trueperaceae bacterium]
MPILIGIAGFVVQRIDFTTEETAIDAGTIEVEAEQRRAITIPDVAAGAAPAPAHARARVKP